MMDYKNELHSDDDFDNSNSYSESFGSNNNLSNSNNNNSSFNGNDQLRSGQRNGLSKAELRKTNKPIMEKRRRARINHCLNELKTLILEAMKKDPARHTKLEKADILEMTVKHLQSVQRQQLNMAIQTDPSVIHKFKTGFVECAEEVTRFVSRLDGIDDGVRQRLTNHLNNCATSLEQIGSMTNFNNGYRGHLACTTPAGLYGSAMPSSLTAAAATTLTAPNTLFPPLPQDLNNNNNISTNNNNNNGNQCPPIQMGGVQLIPSRLPSGEFALIMPNTNTTNAANLINNNNPLLVNPPFTGWPHVPHTNNTNSNINNNGNAVVTGSAQAINMNPLPGHVPSINDFTSNFQRISAFSKPQVQTLKLPNTSTIPAIPNNNNNGNYMNNFTATTMQKTKLSLMQQNSSTPLANNTSGSSTTTATTPPTTAVTSPPLSPVSSAHSVSSHGDDSSIMHTSSDFAASRPTTPPLDITNGSQHNFAGVFSTPPSSAETSLSLSTHLQQQQVSSTSGIEMNSTPPSTGALKRSYSEATTADSNDSSDEPSSKKYGYERINSEAGVPARADAPSEERDCMWRPW